MPAESPIIPDHELLRRIGAGSYGEVWLARNVTGAYRAVKVVYRDNFQEERPFRREFEGIQKFEPISRRHESQVQILHVGTTAHYFYYVMELADDQETGQVIAPESYKPRTLRSELVRLGRLAFDESLRIALALAIALDHLHRQGLAHRDIKPSNIIFVSGIPKLADIGLVAGLDDTRSFVGTEGFVPPEGAGTPQADIYSFGKTLYEMSTGLDRVDFPELPTFLIEQPQREQLLELNAIISRACQANPKDRYRTASEMHAELSLLQSGRSVRKSRSLEWRFKFLSRAAFATLVTGGILGLAFVWQRQQTQQARQLAKENRQLAEKSRQHVFRLQTSAGSRFLAKAEPMAAALMYVEALKISPPASEEAKLQQLRLEWMLRETPMIEQILTHGGAVNAARLSPDGERILTVSDDGTAQVWLAATGQPVGLPLRHESRVVLGQFSPDGNTIATGSADNQVLLWNSRTLEKIGSPLQRDGNIRVLEFSPNGQLLFLGGDRGMAELFDARTGASAMCLKHNGAVLCASFSADGTQLLTGSTDRHARVWNTSNGERIRSMFHKFSVDAVAFNADGSQVLTATFHAKPEPGQFYLWDNRTGNGIWASPFIAGTAGAFVKFSPTGDAIIFGGSPLGLYALATTRLIAKLDHGALRDIAFSADGSKSATASERGGFAYVWNTQTGDNLFPPLKHGGYVNSVQFFRDGKRLLTASDDGTARIWSLSVPSNSLPALVHPHSVRGAVFSPNGEQLLSVTSKDQLHLWDPGSGQTQAVVAVSNSVNGAVFSRNGRKILSGILRTVHHHFPSRTAANSVVVVDATNATTGGVQILPQGVLTAADINATGDYVATGDRSGICQLWNASSGEAFGPPMNNDAGISFIAFSPNDEILFVATRDGLGRFWKWRTAEPQGQSLRHAFTIQHASFSHDGSRLATASLDQTARVWDVKTGKPLTDPLKHRGNLLHVSFSPDDRLIVMTGLSASAVIWDSATGAQVLPSMDHTEGIIQAVFHPHRPILLTCSFDKTARLWDLITGEPLTPPLSHDAGLVGGGFSPDGKIFFTAAADKKLSLWQLPSATRSLEQLTELVQLLGSHHYGPHGALVIEKPETLKRLWEKTARGQSHLSQ